MVKSRVMISRSITLLVLIGLLAGCSPEPGQISTELSGFVTLLKQNGVEGKLSINLPENADIEYVATYAIAAYTSTRILTFFKLSDEQSAIKNLELLMENQKMSGQARNRTILMGATFYPPDDESVNKIKELFINHTF